MLVVLLPGTFKLPHMLVARPNLTAGFFDMLQQCGAIASHQAQDKLSCTSKQHVCLCDAGCSPWSACMVFP